MGRAPDLSALLYLKRHVHFKYNLLFPCSKKKERKKKHVDALSVRETEHQNMLLNSESMEYNLPMTINPKLTMC